MRELTRRETLSGVAAVGAVGLTGCVADDSGGEDDENGDGAGDVEITGRSIRTTNVAEGSQSDSAETHRNGDTVVVEGQIPAPTPCNASTLDAASIDGDELSLTVGIEDVSGDQGCIEVVATVEYEASIELSDASGIGGVTVEHVNGDTHEFGGDELGAVSGGGGGSGSGSGGGDSGDASASSDDVEILESVIETTDTGPRSGDDAESAEISRSDSVITVTGSIPTSTPHYEAVLESVEISGDSVSVTIGTRSTRDEDEAGVQVLGKVEYQAQFVLADAERSACLTVTHESTGSQFTCS